MILETRLGSVVVTPASKFNPEGLAASCMAETGVTARTYCNAGTRSFPLKFQFRPSGDSDKRSVKVLFARNPKSATLVEWNYAGMFPVPVKWIGDTTPHTRDHATNLDCADVFFVEPDGHFVDVEFGLITRNGQFELSAQRVYEGQVVRTRDENNKVVPDFVPVRAIHAYPGSNFRNVWSDLAETLLAAAPDAPTVQKSQAFKPLWNPPAFPADNTGGWIAGVVNYFNLISSTGELEDRDGKKYYVHFKSILAPEGAVQREEVTTLTPMTIALFHPDSEKKREEQGHQRRALRSVKAVKPFLPKEPTN